MSIEESKASYLLRRLFAEFSQARVLSIWVVMHYLVSSSVVRVITVVGNGLTFANYLKSKLDLRLSYNGVALTLHKSAMLTDLWNWHTDVLSCGCCPSFVSHWRQEWEMVRGLMMFFSDIRRYLDSICILFASGILLFMLTLKWVAMYLFCGMWNSYYLFIRFSLAVPSFSL